MKSILSEMHLDHKTGIMGILFYLIRQNERLKFTFFHAVGLDAQIFENSNLSLYQESLPHGCSADAYFEFRSQSKISNIPVQPDSTGVIETNFLGAIPNDHLDRYRQLLANTTGTKYLLTLIPRVPFHCKIKPKKTEVV